MKASDALKVLVMIILAICSVAVLCYAYVDLGMSLDQMITKVESWNSNLVGIAFLVWSVVITFLIANRRRY